MIRNAMVDVGRVIYISLGAWGGFIVGLAIATANAAREARLRVESALDLFAYERSVQVVIAVLTLALVFGGASWRLARTLRWPWWASAGAAYACIYLTILIHRWILGETLGLVFDWLTICALLFAFGGAWLARRWSSAPAVTRPRQVWRQAVPGLFLLAGLALLAVDAIPTWSLYVRQTVQHFDIPVFGGGQVVMKKTAALEQFVRYAVPGPVTQAELYRFYLEALKSSGWEPLARGQGSNRAAVEGGVVAAWRDPRDMLRLVISTEPPSGAVPGSRESASVIVQAVLGLREVSSGDF